MHEAKSAPVLFENKKDCCGCGACMNACLKQAISMQEDQYGFFYPQIDNSLCVKCGACQKVCNYQNKKETHIPEHTYAVCAKSEGTLKRSASGGVFAVLAQKILAMGGVVFGAAFDKTWSVRHIGVESLEELPELQGSKYVQSNTGSTYQQVKHYLKQSRKVLYSGTPCQIAGLYGFLGKDDENLLTVDLICHGVPNQRMFHDYLHSLGTVTDFTFRDKNAGWGKNGSVIIQRNDTSYKKILWESSQPYLYYFVNSFMHRESCYQCKYTCQHRPADITLGDYWGIEKQHPDYLGKNCFSTKKGISVVIANTAKGLTTLRQCSDALHMKDSTFEKAADGNAQLVRPSVKNPERQEILDLYAQQGWDAVARRFHANIGVRKYSSQIKNMIPSCLKKMMKKYRR